MTVLSINLHDVRLCIYTTLLSPKVNWYLNACKKVKHMGFRFTLATL